MPCFLHYIRKGNCNFYWKLKQVVVLIKLTISGIYVCLLPSQLVPSTCTAHFIRLLMLSSLNFNDWENKDKFVENENNRFIC